MNIQAVKAQRIVKRKLLVQTRVKVAKQESLLKSAKEDLEVLEQELVNLDSIIKNFSKGSGK